MNSKPRIYLKFGFWFCGDGTCTGSGTSPERAYSAYVRERCEIAIELSRHA